MILNLFRYRRFIVSNALSDFRNHYAGTTFGILWHVMHPATIVIVLSVVFGSLMPGRATSAGIQFDMMMFLATGLVPWLAFADGLSRGTAALTGNSALLRKLPIPEEVFIAKAVASSYLYLLISLVLLVPIAIARGHPVTLHWALLPVLGALSLLLVFGIALVLACLHVFLRDIGQIVPVALQIGMWATPILYPLELAPSALRALLPLNPFFPFLLAFRALMIDGMLPDVGLWLWLGCWVVGSIVVGASVLRRLRPELRDVL